MLNSRGLQCCSFDRHSDLGLVNKVETHIHQNQCVTNTAQKDKLQRWLILTTERVDTRHSGDGRLTTEK